MHLWPGRLGKIHLLLTLQTGVLALASVNRLTDLAAGYVLPNEFLRWVDFNNMIVFPLITVTILYLLQQHLASSPAAPRSRLALLLVGIVFVVGASLGGISSGIHEVTNYLHLTFCPDPPVGQLCQIIAYHDDTFSHLVFFSGFILVNASLLLTQALFPCQEAVRPRDLSLLTLNGLFVGAAIFANMAFEPIRWELPVVGVLLVLSLALMRKRGLQPLLFYYAVGCTAGIVSTLAYKLLA